LNELLAKLGQGVTISGMGVDHRFGQRTEKIATAFGLDFVHFDFEK